jgi:hypothetical protein
LTLGPGATPASTLTIGQDSLTIGDLAVTSDSATPEPGTLSMLIVAMLIGGGITWRMRRRENSID